MSAFLRRRIIVPIKLMLLHGITPRKIALSLAFGIVLGIFPVLGTTTALCALAAIIFRLNLPTIQLVNYFVYPAQLALILPFIRLGEYMLRVHPTPLSLEQMIAVFRANHLQALQILWKLALHGVFAWVVIAPIMFFVLYRLFLHSIDRLARHLKQVRRINSTAADYANRTR